eukprot:TRINITY_DN5819_c0_g1_i5.p1 TRINITY_DN5819_c0_g1~~TRINITY_DN5819_c0_g1_i5.p1  ORF type:complete len:1027 (+),score=219.39 TRINITY_DN5819_c0_g1_i5:249-3329(+)
MVSLSHHHMMIPLLLLLVCGYMTLPVVVYGIGQSSTIAFVSSADSLLLGDDRHSVQLIVDEENDWKGVVRVVNDLALDFGRVTGLNGTVSSLNGSVISPSPSSWSSSSSSSSIKADKGGVIIAGTLGKSSIIDKLVSSGKIKVDGVRGQWEAFTSALVFNPIPGIQQALIIAGNDKRGTIFGLYDISEQIGVSPWYWWADVAPTLHKSIYALNTIKLQPSPSIKYRGLFLNDNAPALTGWINAKYPPSPYGAGYDSRFYSHVFELLLRLRANYIWPAGADWGQAFFIDDPLNQPLADEYGIVMGTSHTEPMVRATDEWALFGHGPWDWSTNNASIIPFMREGAMRAHPYENVITMGMRGTGDTAMSPTIQPKLLEDIVNTQRQILQDVYGPNVPINKIPQMWCLYKEVQGYYEQGMRVPDDIILLWADDNFGNIRRLPIETEYNRTGGACVYYLFDYVGGPRNYKWINTVQLQRTWEQMHLAYERQARTIWMVNVGDLKPLEIPTHHFFDLAYDITLWDDAKSVSRWLTLWVAQQFGQEYAQSTADLLTQYSMLVGRRRFELIDQNTYSIINYNEADYVLGQWTRLSMTAETQYRGIPKSRQAAFFEMVLHPIQAGANLHDIYISAAKNNLYAAQGRNSANDMAQRMLDGFDRDYDLTDQYNTILGGKWEHMMDQTHIGYTYWNQPIRQATPPVQYIQRRERALTGDLGVSVEGKTASIPAAANAILMMPVDPYFQGSSGGHKPYIDIYNTGTNRITWTIQAPPYIIITQYSGTLAPKDADVRVFIDVNWSSVPLGSSSATINISSSTDYGTQSKAPQVILPLIKRSVPDNFTLGGFVESDGHISIEAEHWSRIISPSSPNPDGVVVSYDILPSFGRTLSGVALVPGTAPSQTIQTGPHIEYDFYSFTATTSSHPANISVVLGSSLNMNPGRPLKYAIGIDNLPPKTVQYVFDQPAGQMPVDWDNAVSNAAWIGQSSEVISSSSSSSLMGQHHTLKLWALEPGVIFQKVWIDMGGVRPSYLGPPES